MLDIVGTHSKNLELETLNIFFYIFLQYSCDAQVILVKQRHCL